MGAYEPRGFYAGLALAARREEEAQTTIEQARNRLFLRCSYSRLDELLYLFREMSYADWLAVCGEAWSCCDNIGAARLLLRQLLPAHGPVAPMMDTPECMAWDALPERLTIYRGCGPSNMLGASWSLNRDTAARFPFLNRYRQPKPLLVTATVKKSHVLAIKLDRKESEIIAFSAHRIAVDELQEAPQLAEVA